MLIKPLLFALYDKKAEFFLAPTSSATRQSMIRTLQDAVRKPDAGSALATHPEDFDLYYLGGFDDKSGTIHQNDSDSTLAPTFVVNAADLRLATADVSNPFTP